MRIKTVSRARKKRARQSAPQYLRKNGKLMVVLAEAEYERLRRKADEWEPLLPEPLPSGNYPAREYMLASIARSILRRRRRLGFTQVELARRAGIRPETLQRIEQGTHAPSVPTIDKIDRALKLAEGTNTE